MGWADIFSPLVSGDLFKSLLSGGISDAVEGYNKYKKGGSFFDFLDRGIDPGGTVDKGTRALGEQLPDEIRQVAPTIGGVVGSIWGPGGAAAGAGVGSKIAGDDTQTGMQKAGTAAVAAYIFGGGNTGAGASSGASTEVGVADLGAGGIGESAGMGGAGEASSGLYAGMGGAGEGALGASAGSSTGAFDKLLSNKLLIKYLTSMGSDLMKYGGDTSQGMQFTNTNNVTNQQVQTQQFTQLMQQLLSEDGSSGKFDKKGITVNADKGSALYRNFLGENDWFKADSSLMLGDKEDVFSKPAMSKIMTTPNQLDVQRSREKVGNNPNLMRGSFNAANPFFGNA